MAIEYKFDVDWDQDGYFCVNAKPGDPLNLVTEPLDWSDFGVAAIGAGGSVTLGGDADEGGDFVLSDWTSGTAATAYVQHGGPLDSIAAVSANNAPFTLIFWMRSLSASYDAVQLQVEVRNASNSLITTSSAFTVTVAEGLKKIVVPFTTLGSGNGVSFRVSRVGSTTSVRFLIQQIMVVAGTYSSSAAPDFNVGHPSNMYDRLNRFIKQARWNIGARQAYVAVADLNVLTLTLNNAGKEFSPENPSSGLNGLMADRWVRVRMDSDSSIERGAFFGYTQSVRPTTGIYSGPFEAVLIATSSRRYWEGQEARLALQTSVTADDVIAALAAEITRPPSVPGLDGLDAGTYTWPYAADDWGDGVDALSALADVVRSERGFVYWSAAEDVLVFKNRTWRYGFDGIAGGLAATFDNDFEGNPDYDYGEDIINHVEVKYGPRRVGASQTIWELDETPLTIPANSSVRIVAKYRINNTNKMRIAASSVAEGTYTTSATINVAYQHRANQTIITYTNPHATNPRNVTAHTLTGTAVVPANTISLVDEDAVSIALYGKRSLFLNLPLVNRRADAAEIIANELARHKDPKGHIRSMTFNAHRSSTFEGYAVEMRPGLKVRVIDDQVVHDGNYMVIGVEHEVVDAMATHRVTLFLEPSVDVL